MAKAEKKDIDEDFLDLIDAVIVSVKHKLETGRLDRVINLLNSKEVEKILEKIDMIEYEEDFMLQDISSFYSTISRRYLLKNDRHLEIDISDYNEAVKTYEAYLKICSVFHLGQSSTVLGHVFDVLCNWRDLIVSLITQPSLPYEYMVSIQRNNRNDDPDLPF